MVKRLINILNKEISGLHEAAYLLGFFAILSQVLALVRDRFLAYYFGPGQVLDIYYAGFRIPDFIFAIFASIVSISVLVPFLTDKFCRSKEEGKEFIDNIFSFFFISIVAFSLLAFFVMPYIIPWVFPGFTDQTQIDKIVAVSRIMLLSPILLGLSNLLGSITQVFKRFVIYSISPLFYNIGIIIGIIFFYPIFGVYGLALGVVLGAVAHLGIQVPFVSSQRLLPKIKVKINYSFIKEVITISIPRTITLASSQLSILILLSMASILGIGSISVFNLSFNLQSVPLSIIGVSYSIAAFPTLAKLFSAGEKENFLKEVIISARHIIFLSLPIIVLFIVLRAQIVRTVLGAGQFDWTDTRLTAAALALFTISVLFQSLNLLLIRAYYAAGDTIRPLLANCLSAVLGVVFSLILVKMYVANSLFHYFIESLLRVENIANTSVLMLPLGYSLGMFIGGIWLIISFDKRYKGLLGGIVPVFFQSFSAAVITGFIAYLGLNIFDDIFNLETLIGIFGQGLASGLLGLTAWVVTLKLLKSRELRDVWTTLHHKIWKAKPIPVEVSEL